MPPQLKSRAIIVLGMHRSGTSAFTGLLSLLGVDLGPRLMPASPDNESGYWEHQEVVDVHDRLLLALGSRWDDPGRLPEGWWRLEAVESYRARLREVLARDFGGSRPWALKDPRMCRLLPLWIPLIEEVGCEAAWVLVTRHPAENIRSLEKRDGFSREKSELLWLHHTFDSERETRGRNRVVITFDQFLEDPQGTLGRVQRAAGVPWPVPPERAGAQIQRFVDPDKRHHRAVETGGLSPWSREAYEGLLAGARGDEGEMRALVERAQAGFETADALYQPVIRDRAVELKKCLAEAEAKYAATLDGYLELKEKYRVAKEKLAVKSAESKAKKEELREMERSAGGKLNRMLGRFKRRKKEAVERVDFPAAEGVPEVSIIVSSGGPLAGTARCLRSVREQTAGGNFEVLVVGDHGCIESVGKWENIRTVQRGRAQTFGEPHNRAAQQARGLFLVLLDDSVSVEAGWREALLEPLRSMPEAGMVGAEGGVLGRDGSIKLMDETGSGPLREADFCTTACFAISKNLFFQVGGFDGYYLPVEEANFALKIRQTRHKVLHQPACKIVKNGPGRQIDPGRMESNRPKFMRRWAEALAHHA